MFSSPLSPLLATMMSVLLLIILLLVSSVQADFNGFVDCKQQLLQCGDHSFKVDYPFRLPQSQNQCGYPGFELYCTDNTPLIQIGSTYYKVNDIDYIAQEIYITDSNFANGTSCPQNPFTNFSFDPLLFEYSYQDLNLTLYLNCPPNLSVPKSYLYNLSCGKTDPLYQSFYTVQNDLLLTATIEALSRCESVVYVPVNKTEEAELTTDEMSGLLGALKEGFGMIWKVGEGWCRECVETFGICGYNSSSPKERVCYCSDSTSQDGECVPNAVPATKQNKKKDTGKIIGIVVGGGGGFIILCSLAIFVCKRRKRHQQLGLSGLLSWSSSSKISSKKDLEIGESIYHTHIFSYDELEEATDGFNASRELGDGGFGTVYKGKLRDGRTVAVKRLYEHNYRRVEQFMNEVEILSRLFHQNLVTLYGCTSRHSRELLLVYEYIPNGTVADHLHGSLASESGFLPWPIRLSIAIETANALAYLHAVEPQIIHRDVKTNNILLNNNFHVKVADFGLSRLFPLDATHVSTAPQGTPGYVDPEYHQCYQLTDKSDVYSFGVVLVELVSSKPAVDISRHRHEINLANLAVNKIQNSQLDQLVDPELGYDIDLEVKRMIDQVAELAFRCLQSDGEMRPGIREVLEMLRVIECGTPKEEREGDGSEVQMKEESRLLKSVVQFSPDSVTGKWPSRSTTPNTST